MTSPVKYKRGSSGPFRPVSRKPTQQLRACVFAKVKPSTQELSSSPMMATLFTRTGELNHLAKSTHLCNNLPPPALFRLCPPLWYRSTKLSFRTRCFWGCVVFFLSLFRHLASKMAKKMSEPKQLYRIGVFYLMFPSRWRGWLLVVVPLIKSNLLCRRRPSIPPSTRTRPVCILEPKISRFCSAFLHT